MSAFPVKNWVTLVILRVLVESPMHGYKLMEYLNESGYLLDDKIETGTLYTTLRRLEKKELLASNWENPPNEKRRRVYKITEAGELYLKEIIESIMQRKTMIQDMVRFYKKTYPQE
jgi:DNA-binding PadR family transcriptional regulator